MVVSIIKTDLNPIVIISKAFIKNVCEWRLCAPNMKLRNGGPSGHHLNVIPFFIMSVVAVEDPLPLDFVC